MYRFRLQRVLDFRAKQLDARRLELRAAEHLVQKLREQQTVLAQARAALDQDHALPSQQAADALGLARGLKQLQLILLQAQEIETELAKRLAERDVRREAVLLAHRQMKSLERLSARRRENFEAKLRTQERKILDDISGRKGGKALRRPAKPAG